MSLKVRLVVMNFLEFAVWGAYLTCMGNYLNGRSRVAYFLVLCHTGNCFHIHADIDRDCR